MEQYSNWLVSREYANFIIENREYAHLCGYNITTKRGLTEAMADQFLFPEFIKEQTDECQTV